MKKPVKFAAAVSWAAAFLRTPRRRVAAAVALAAIAGCAGFLALRPRPVFLVETAYADIWRGLMAARPDAPRWKVVEFDPSAGPPAAGRRYGFRISTARSAGSPGESGGPPAPIRDLARAPSADGALALALDPWLVFRRRPTPRLSRERAEAPPGRGAGVLLLPGGDPEAIWAWTAQRLQARPGVFPSDEGLWLDRMERLPRDGGFQAGALTYTWEDLWPRLFGPEAAWVYAPLSRIQAFPGDVTSRLEGNRFPEREGWNEYGIQARILWAVPFGSPAFGKKSKTVAAWLADAGTQTYLAGALKWVPANRAAKPVNPLAAAAQKAWVESSFVWEARSYEKDR